MENTILSWMDTHDACSEAKDFFTSLPHNADLALALSSRPDWCRWALNKSQKYPDNNVLSVLAKADIRGFALLLWSKLANGADLYSANLRRADLSGANLRGADLRGADLYSADLSGADLYGADLRGADLYGADLSGADLRGADLYGADLYGADLYGADLEDANLSGTKGMNI